MIKKLIFKPDFPFTTLPDPATLRGIMSDQSRGFCLRLLAPTRLWNLTYA